jgi:DNA-binding NtrC family response regulator
MQTDVEVMVLDDEPTVGERLKEFLEKERMKVETFTDSQTAVARLAEKRFHVVVTDLKMKGPTGLDVLVAVKSRDLPTEVIIITGYPAFEDKRASECAGAFAFVDKPFHMEQLHELIKKAARKASQRV